MLLKKNNMYLVIGIIVAVIVSVFVVIIFNLKRKLKMQEESFNEQIEKLGVEDLRKEKDELIKSIECLKERILDVEQERDEIDQEIKRLDQDLELFKNKCEYYINTDSVNMRQCWCAMRSRARLFTLSIQVRLILRSYATTRLPT